jgi:YfiR/HmsC-like
MGVLTRRRWRFALLSVILCRGVAAAQPQTVTVSSEYQLKGAFLLNFARYIEWPDAAFASETSPLSICVTEPNPFGKTLEKLIAGESVGAHPVSARVVSPDALTGCHMVFVPRTSRDDTVTVLRSTQKNPVVTVGEESGFTTAGGIINLVNREGRIRFEINAAAARRKGLRISSRLQALALNSRD